MTSLPFQKAQHRINTTDAQPIGGGRGILVLVTGALFVDAAPAPLSFSQTFLLAPDGGSFYVACDIFNLVYPAS